MFNESMLAKLQKIKESSIDAYPPRAPKPTHKAEQIKSNFEAYEGKQVGVCGRITIMRGHGKAMFMVLDDETGKIQLYVKLDNLGADKYKFVTDTLDIGDLVCVSGEVFKTHTGETTIAVKEYTLAAKALEPLPEKFHGLKDSEVRYRKRHLDMIANPEVRDRFTTRTRIIKAMREFLWSKDFVEVDTPILQPLYGGALAKPFTTHHNALDMDLYLRIAPELYLKRLMVGGMPRIFEIGKAFRNEGISLVHNPEFTIMELYQAWADYGDMMEITEQMVAYIANEILGTTMITYQGQQVDLTPPWKRMTMKEAFKEIGGVEIEDLRDSKFAFKYLESKGIQIDKKPSFGAFCDEVLKKVVEPTIVNPTFIYDYPLELSPLAKLKPGETNWVERFQPIVCGFEIGNAFSELNDPLDQLSRFESQQKAKTLGDDEAHETDTDFVETLGSAMPPTGGLGIGVDRLVMLLTDQTSIREVLPFPQLRRTSGDLS